MSENVSRANADLAWQREQVAAQREDLGRTIAELAGRVDVTARAREQSARLQARVSKAGPELVLGAVALLSAVASVVAFTRWFRGHGHDHGHEPTD